MGYAHESILQASNPKSVGDQGRTHDKTQRQQPRSQVGDKGATGSSSCSEEVQRPSEPQVPETSGTTGAFHHGCVMNCSGIPHPTPMENHSALFLSSCGIIDGHG